MEKLLRSLAWYADTVLSICWPVETPPEVEEEVRSGFNSVIFTAEDEVGGGGRVGPEDVWPEDLDAYPNCLVLDPRHGAHCSKVFGHEGMHGYAGVFWHDPLSNSELEAVRALLSSAAPSVADSPGSVAPPADPGQPLTAGTVKEAGVAINAWLEGSSPRAEDRAYWGNLAEDLFHIADSLK